MQVSSKIVLIISVVIIIVSCAPVESEATPTSTPHSSVSNGLVSTSTAQRPTTTSTAFISITEDNVDGTAYIPISNGTPFPLSYEQISPETAGSITLIARWKTNLRLEDLAFASNRDIVCASNQEVIQSWDIFSGEFGSVSNLCGKPLVNRNFGKWVISPDNQFAAEISTRIRYGYLTVSNLLRPDTYLYYYLDDIAAVGFSSIGEYLVIAFNDGQVWFIPKSKWKERLLDLEPGYTNYDTDLIPELVINVGKAPLQIQFSPDDQLMALLFQDQTIQVWKVSDLSLQSVIRHTNLVNSTSNETPSSYADELLSEENLGRVSKIAIAPNNLVMATMYTDNYIRLWDTQTGNLLTTLRDGTVDTGLVFSPTNRLLASIHNGDSIYIWGILPGDLDIAEVNATAVANSVLNSTAQPASFPKPTTTPTSSILANLSKAPLSWAISMPSERQITEASNCNIEALAKTRYPETISYWEFEKAHPLITSCDWSVLAFAYQSDFENKASIPEEGRRVFFESVRQNPAFAMTTSLFYPYFNSVELVAMPPMLKQPITSVVIDYEWSGIGEPSNIQYHIEIDNANSDQIILNIETQPEIQTNNVARAVDSKEIQELSKALTDFLPIRSPFTMQTCYDNYPDWNITLTFLDGTNLKLDTHGSNFLTPGGPWFMELYGQNYIQFSSALVSAVLGMFESLELPIGQPHAMYCSQVETFQMAFP